jgi:hypothetical protein
MSSTPPDSRFLPRSVVEAWRADTASSLELRAGYARFSRRRARRSAVPRALSVAGVLLLGIGLAQAAALLPARWFRSPGAAPRPSASGAASSKARPSKPSVPQERSTAPLTIPTEDQAALVPAPAAPPPVAPGSTPLPRPPAAAPASSPEVDEQWRRAAAALRDDDFERARSALIEIERSAGSDEGDAARLARAQLLASRGHRDEALALARVLAEQARPTLVRENARRLVAKLIEEENATSDRSIEQLGEDKLP